MIKIAKCSVVIVEELLLVDETLKKAISSLKLKTEKNTWVPYQPSCPVQEINMSTYFAVEIIRSLNPIQEYEIENQIELWKRRYLNAHIIKTETEAYEKTQYNHALFLKITYQANSRVAQGSASKAYENHLINFPENYNNTKTNDQDGSKGVGYAAREHGKFGSYPEHDDYSEES